MDNKFHTSVYRKNTFTGLASNYNSFVPNIFKLNLITVLVFRAWKICSSSIALSKEIEFITNFLLNNAFPRPYITGQVDRALNKFRSQGANAINETTSGVEKYFLRFQYYGHTSHKLKSDLLAFVDKYFPPNAL